jgi:Zn-finger nucleic acid-binding protein
MLTFPSCKDMLDKKRSRLGFFWICPSCKGRTMTLGTAKKVIPRQAVYSLWQNARQPAVRWQNMPGLQTSDD